MPSGAGGGEVFGERERAKHRPFLRLMLGHAAQNVVEHADRVDDVWAFIEHHAFARSDIAASVISARDGRPSFASYSSTCVAQITGTCAASQIHRISCSTTVSSIRNAGQRDLAEVECTSEAIAKAVQPLQA